MRDNHVAMGRLPTRLEREDAARRAWVGARPAFVLPAAKATGIVRPLPQWALSTPAERIVVPARAPEAALSPAPRSAPAFSAPARPQTSSASALTCPTCKEPKSLTARPGPCRACWRLGAAQRKEDRKARAKAKAGRLIAGSPEHRKAVGERARARWAAMSAEERTAVGRRAAATRLATQPKEVRAEATRKRRAAQTPEQKRALAVAGAAGLHSRPWAVRSARAKKAAASRTERNLAARQANTERLREYWNRLTPEQKRARALRAAEARRTSPIAEGQAP